MMAASGVVLKVDGKKQRHGAHRPDSRQHPDQGPDEYPDKAIEQILGLEGDGETDSQII